VRSSGKTLLISSTISVIYAKSYTCTVVHLLVKRLAKHHSLKFQISIRQFSMGSCSSGGQTDKWKRRVCRGRSELMWWLEGAFPTFGHHQATQFFQIIAYYQIQILNIKISKYCPFSTEFYLNIELKLTSANCFKYSSKISLFRCSVRKSMVANWFSNLSLMHKYNFEFQIKIDLFRWITF
jgi:hypothetical protein